MRTRQNNKTADITAESKGSPDIPDRERDIKSLRPPSLQGHIGEGRFLGNMTRRQIHAHMHIQSLTHPVLSVH